MNRIKLLASQITHSVLLQYISEYFYYARMFTRTSGLFYLKKETGIWITLKQIILSPALPQI